MRTLLSGLLGLLSVVLLPVALVAMWVSLMLTRTDVFVDEVRPLISTPAVQDALTEGVVDSVLTTVELPPPVEKLAEPVIRETAGAVIRSPEMEATWGASMESLHQEFTAVMEGRTPAGLDDQGRVVIAVPIALPALAPALGPLGVVVDRELKPVVTIPVASAKDLDEARFGYSVLETLGVWAPFAVAGLGVLSIALAWRRARAAALIAIGWAVGAVLLGLALFFGRPVFLPEIADPTVRALANAVYAMAQRGLFTEIGVVLVVAVGLLVVTGLVSAGRRRF